MKVENYHRLLDDKNQSYISSEDVEILGCFLKQNRRISLFKEVHMSALNVHKFAEMKSSLTFHPKIPSEKNRPLLIQL